MRQSRRHVGFLAVVFVAGLLIWFAYVAVQPHDYSRSSEAPDFLRTFFGWNAPGIRRTQIELPDRSWIILVGWPLLGFVAGWCRPALWRSIGLVAVIPAWVIFFPTAPRDIDGLWGLGVVFLPVMAAVVAGCAAAAGKIRSRFEPLAAEP